MKIILDKKNKGYLQLGLIFGALTILGLISVRIASPYLTHLPGCTFHNITGIPCPSCGATRSAVLLANGNFFNALKMNPLFLFFYIGLLAWGSFSLLMFCMGKKISVKLSYLEARIIRWGAVAVILLNWTYLIIANSTGFCKI